MPADKQITAIRATRRDPGRATVYVDGGVGATLSYKHVDELGLTVGRPWDAALAEQVHEAAAFDKAMKQAMNRLNRRMLSEGRLDRKLRDLEFGEAVRGRVLDRLRQLGLLDDEALGRALIRETLNQKPAGPALLEQKLVQRGIERGLARRLANEAAQQQDQVEQAILLGRKRLRSMRRLDGSTAGRRLYGLLARRGFAPDTVRAAMQTLTDELKEARASASP